MKYLLDTNVYLTASGSEETKKEFRKSIFPLLPVTYLSAVVAYELSVDARDRRTAELLREFIYPMQRAGRVISPTFEDWVEAARVVTAIHDRERSWRSKLPALQNDVLIALTARRIGAMLLTFKRDDFRLIRHHTDFFLRILGVEKHSGFSSS